MLPMRDPRVRPSASLVTILVERIYDLIAVALMFAINLIWFSHRSRSASHSIAFALAGFALVGAIVLGIVFLALVQKQLATGDRIFERLFSRCASFRSDWAS